MYIDFHIFFMLYSEIKCRRSRNLWYHLLQICCLTNLWNVSCAAVQLHIHISKNNLLTSGSTCFICYCFITGRLPWQPAGIKFTQCVSGQKSAYSPLQEKLCAGSKNDWHLLELSGHSLSACKVWGDRTKRAGCNSENWCFFVCHAWSACAWGA